MSTQNLNTQIHRIGGVSGLTGVPVSTLRMWEGRYGAFSPGKSQGRHRLYSDEDVLRARLLRQLSENGHSIGGIARLPAQELQRLVVETRSVSARGTRDAEPSRLSLVVVGSALATRLLLPGWSARLGGALLDIRAAFPTVDNALADAEAAGAGADLLIARVNAVPPGGAQALQQLAAHVGAKHGILLYNFGAQASIAAVRESGFLVRREPVDDAELAELLRSTTWTQRDAPAAADAALPVRRHSEEFLAEIAARPTRMLCECPRHLAEIIEQLASFEAYSAECLNRSDEDARVHAHLRSVAGSARAMFEGALDVVLAHDGDGRRA
ncbi:MerR family transcriptional regulator [Ramlibacter albus]|uniref:MerR family transcriptional regulator n=1 Tax=Ramlibacter albus TaxID=2079448 RepID=A0A923S433_9BURK|nr:MerR family transcriptional regulator [Ramlibacter albus]MBC5766493.1 MerR family transcriptional regulator [Ramlibacter albus]